MLSCWTAPGAVMQMICGIREWWMILDSEILSRAKYCKRPEGFTACLIQFRDKMGMKTVRLEYIIGTRSKRAGCIFRAVRQCFGDDSEIGYLESY